MRKSLRAQGNQSMPQSPLPLMKKALITAMALCGVGVFEAHSAPTGGVVVDGVGSITQANNTTRIQQDSQNLSLQWDTFDVQRNERVTFNQPNANAIALNRILDANGSQILGRIDANGQVVLVNPNGIFFGRNASVNVGGLIASGLDVQAGSLEDGSLTLTGVAGTSGLVVNEGIISASSGGHVALIGKEVLNEGFIQANLGQVALVGANSVVVSFDDSLLGIKVDEETQKHWQDNSPVVINDGNIQASGGSILLSASVAQDLFSAAVNSGNLSDRVAVALNAEGGFSLGGGNGIVNSGSLDVSSYGGSDQNAGNVIVAAAHFDNSGVVSANAYGNNAAGEIFIESQDVLLSGVLEAESDIYSGIVRIRATALVAENEASIRSSGETRVWASYGGILPEISTHHLNLGIIDTITQAGSITATGLTQLLSVLQGSVELLHEDNDFNVVRADIGHAASVKLVDKNDLILSALNLNDGLFEATSLGENSTIRQLEETQIDLNDSFIHLNAANVILGENGASTYALGGGFYVNFAKQIALNGSVTVYEGSFIDYRTRSRITGTGTYDYDAFLEVTSRGQVDVNAIYDGGHLTVENILGENASFTGAYLTATQTGAIQLSDTLNWIGYQATFDNLNNDVQSVKGILPTVGGSLVYVDRNDLALGDISGASYTSVSVSSVGNDASVSQADNTSIVVSNLHLAADNIDVGANGSSSILVENSLSFEIGKNLLIDGFWDVNSYFTHFKIIGSDDSNHVEFGVNSSSVAFGNVEGSFLIDLKGGNDTLLFNAPVNTSEYAYINARVDMGSGNDKVYIRENVNLPIYLGAGRDSIYVWNPLVDHNLAEIDYMEDRLIYGAWRNR